MAERRTRPNPRQRRYRTPAVPPGAEPQPETDEPDTDLELLAEWQHKIGHARRIRRDWEEHFQVEVLERFYAGDHLEYGAGSDRAPIYLNHFAATVEAQRPALLPASVSFLVEPKPGRPPQDRVQAKILGSVLDAIALEDGHLMPVLRLAATQAFFRFGVLKVTYDPQMYPNPDAGKPLLNALDEALVGPGGEQLTEPDQLMSEEVYRWQWVQASRMLLPDEGPDRSRWTWIAEEIEMPLDDAKQDPAFPAHLRTQLVSNGRLDEMRPQFHYVPGQEDAAPEMFRYVECWDVSNERRYAWAEGQLFEGFLINETMPDGVEDHPYALFMPLPILGPIPSPYPKPLTTDWLPLQQQYNIIRTQQIEGGKRAARKLGYDDNTFPDADEAQKYLSSPQDMQAVKLNDTAHPPVPLGDIPQSADVSRNIPYLLADWQRVTGATGTRLGNPDADTATEAVMAEQSANVRDSEMRTKINEWLAEAGRKMLQLVQQTLTLDLWVQITDLGDKELTDFMQTPGFQAYLALRVGPQNVPGVIQMLQSQPQAMELLRTRFGQLKPLRVSRAGLQMEAQVSVQPSTMRPVYRAQLLQLVQLLGPAALLSPTLVEEVLNSFELPQGDRIAEEILSNLQRQQQMQQMQQMQQQGGLPGMPGRPGGRPPLPGTPQPQAAASPLGTTNTLGAVTGGVL